MKERGRRPLRAAAESVRAVAEVNDLTWSGQPEGAIALATALLERGGLSPGQQAELLDLRAENLHWSGETERSAQDVRALGALARRERKPAMQAMALRREVYLHMRRGEQAEVVRKARAALAAADRS